VSEFVDANVFIRLITRDDLEKANRCLQLFQQARRGEIQLATSEAVVAEVVFVLASRELYALPRAVIAADLGAMLSNNGLHLDYKEMVLVALDLYESTNLHFVDCLCVVHARRLDAAAIFSYDRGLDRVPGVRRLEP
jgi:predicted nucleic acid-binding protein